MLLCVATHVASIVYGAATRNMITCSYYTPPSVGHASGLGYCEGVFGNLPK
jgi:hypothetical protein